MRNIVDQGYQTKRRIPLGREPFFAETGWCPTSKNSTLFKNRLMVFQIAGYSCTRFSCVIRVVFHSWRRGVTGDLNSGKRAEKSLKIIGVDDYSDHSRGMRCVLFPTDDFPTRIFGIFPACE